MKPKKELGQHWLHDDYSLQAIADAAEIEQDDTVLEIGPGLGTLTQVLVERAKQVVAVEFDHQLSADLPRRVTANNLTIVNADILSFNLQELPAGYKVVANVPYYITSKIVQLFAQSDNPPSVAVLLVQKEVAERLAAGPGDLSILAISAQVYFEMSLGIEVPAYLFTPPPKVDSQVVILRRRSEPLVPEQDIAAFFRVVKAGFSEKRKQLRSSLAGGLQMEKSEVESWLERAGIASTARAQELSIDQWQQLAVIM